MNFFMEDTGKHYSDSFFKDRSGMEATCPRCAGKGTLYSESSFLKITLSGEEKNEEIPSGIYFFQLLNKESSIYEGKFVKE